MGQVIENMKKITSMEERVPFDEDSKNGFIFEDKYIPVELVLELLTWIDYKTLLNCQLVCKNWNDLIKKCIWKKKAEITVGHSLPINDKAPWTMYYYICSKKFDKNLIKNHSGQNGFHKSWNTRKENGWQVIDDGGDGWIVEHPPAGVPELPNDPVFEGKSYCFVTSYYKGWKHQIIHLIDEGINEHLLDSIQPIIKVSEYYSCRWDCDALYVCTIELLTEDNVVLDSYNFSKILEGDDQNQWFKFEHEFEKYGKGLRKIRFCHGGQDKKFWAGHYGSKMAGACIKLGIPSFEESAESKDEVDENL